ncbi:MAG: phage portal protein, partial [Planctomycetes bacterium]|nr:phage portal protein [Planctomycetota bacterium]
MGVFSRRFINGDFEDKPQFNHPLQRILDNPTLDPATRSITHSAQQLWGMVVSHILSVGESYLLVLMDGAGIPTGLQIAQPGALEPVVSGGRVTAYRVLSATGGSSRTLRPADVIRIWQPETYDLFTARGVMGQQADEINMDAHVTETWRTFFKNNATPPILFETDDPDAAMPTPEQEKAQNESMLRRFNRRLGSMLGGGFHVKPRWKAKVLDSTLESAAGVQMMQWTSQQVFEGLRVSPSLVGRNVDVNRAAAETARFTFDQNTVEPLTRLIAEALTLQLANHYPQTGDVQLIVKYRPFIARDKDFELRKDELDSRMFIRSNNEIRQDREPSLPAASWADLPLGSPLIGPITGDIAEPIDLSGFGLEPADATIGLGDAVPEEGEPEEERSRAGFNALRRARANMTPEKEWAR